jgi:hypothetical protein
LGNVFLGERGSIAESGIPEIRDCPLVCALKTGGLRVRVEGQEPSPEESHVPTQN